MMRKERLFYLDFIRAIATISILLTHFNAIYIFSYHEQLDKVVITGKVFGLYIGDFGVSLFFIISGAALMYVYGEKIELKNFFYRRFKSIFPMFWVAYFFAFLYFFFINKSIPVGIPKKNILLTFFGFDGYLTSLGLHVPNFYILGEWFLGAIILLYLIFPLLRFGVKKYPVLCAIIVGIMYIVCSSIYSGELTKSCIIFNRIPEMIFGMYFIEYFNKVNIKVAIFSLLVCVINSFVKFPYNSTIQTTYIGIAVFLLLVYISAHINNNILIKFCEKISKYSYAIFLVHHVVIQEITKSFDMSTISKTNSYILFILCCVVICFLAKILFSIDHYISKEITKWKK